MHAQLPMLSARGWRSAAMSPAGGNRMGSSAAVVEALQRTTFVRGAAENVLAQCRVKRRASPVPFRSNGFPGFIKFKGFTWSYSSSHCSRSPEYARTLCTPKIETISCGRVPPFSPCCVPLSRRGSAFPTGASWRLPADGRTRRTGADGRERAGPGDESHHRYFCHLAAR